MNEYDYGPLQSFEVTWRTGHVETLQGHSVSFDSLGFNWAGTPVTDPKFRLWGMFPGRHWRLVLCAPEAELLSIRNVTEDEQVTP